MLRLRQETPVRKAHIPACAFLSAHFGEQHNRKRQLILKYLKKVFKLIRDIAESAAFFKNLVIKTYRRIT